METLTTTKPSAPSIVNAVCVAVEDLGIVDTPYGEKPQVKFTFESDVRNEYGQQRRFVRIFNKYFNDKSALSIAVKSWSGRDLAAEMENIGEVDLQSFVDDQMRLKLEPITTKAGKPFDKIVDFIPAGAVHVQPTQETK
jgi:hypothetical protein